MVDPHIIEERPIPLAVVKEKLKAVRKRDEELTFRGTKTEEYLNQFTILKLKDAEELFEKIEKLKVPRLKEEYVYKIVDLLPKDATELKNILTGYSLNVTSENIAKILGLVEEYLPKKK